VEGGQVECDAAGFGAARKANPGEGSVAKVDHLLGDVPEDFPFLKPEGGPPDELVTPVVVSAVGDRALLVQLGIRVKRLGELRERAPTVHVTQQLDVLIRHRLRSISTEARRSGPRRFSSQTI
jgi:hypothetical protein